jgi:hypothetical protein
MLYEFEFLFGLIASIIVETIVLFFLVRKVFLIKEKSISSLHLVFTGFIATFSTLPYVWFILPIVLTNFLLYVAVSEVFAIVGEALIYYFVIKISIRRVFVISLVCNLASFVLGSAFLTALR